MKIIRNSTKNVEFEIRIRGQIWSLNSNSTKFDSRIGPKVGQIQPLVGQIWSKMTFWIKKRQFFNHINYLLWGKA